MHVAEIWRYPVKSMRGERLDEAELRLDGIAGDRLVHVRNRQGRIATARVWPGLLGLQGSLDADGRPLVDGRPWDDPASLAAVRAIVQDGELVHDDGIEARYDVLPLTVATDGAIAALGADGRRLRPNLVVAGVDGLDERTWPGRMLKIGGDVLCSVARVRPRCVMTTYDPDTLEQDRAVFRRIVDELGGALALDVAVVRAGVIRVGDEVTLRPAGP